MDSDSSLPEGSSMGWQKDVPYDVRQEAIKEAMTAFKTNAQKVKLHQVSNFKVSFKSKKNATSQIFHVNKNALNVEKMRLFVMRLKHKGKLRMRKRDVSKYFDDDTLDGNFIVQKVRPDKWYICLPRKRVATPDSSDEKPFESVFLDPGVRTFQTIYSPDGICGKIGEDVFTKEIQYIAMRHDYLWNESFVEGVPSKTKRGLRKRCALLRDKLKNKVDDLHWQTASLLCKSFKNIFIPTFEVSKMVKGSPLGCTITRRMLQLSHGKFKERLAYLGSRYGSNVIFVGEEYTTKTCGVCGNIQEMKGNKVFNCRKCTSEIDRDVNGARNICLKLISQMM
jgi:putative transposase